MKTLMILAISFFITICQAFPQQGIIPFESERWNLEEARQAEFLGQKCLMGIASLKLSNMDMENTISLKLTSDQVRSPTRLEILWNI